MTVPAVELDGIWKRFPGVIANSGANLTVRPGTVHAVLGENGAGKTTLMNCLAGVYRPDEGAVRLGGQEMSFSSPADAIAAGVGMVHQEFRLVPTFTVAENVVLGAAPRIIDQGGIEASVADLAARFGFDADPARPVWQLSMGERQRVEILKALWRDANVLILDEPTGLGAAAFSAIATQVFANPMMIIRPSASYTLTDSIALPTLSTTIDNSNSASRSHEVNDSNSHLQLSSDISGAVLVTRDGLCKIDVNLILDVTTVNTDVTIEVKELTGGSQSVIQEIVRSKAAVGKMAIGFSLVYHAAQSQSLFFHIKKNSGGAASLLTTSTFIVTKLD